MAPANPLSVNRSSDNPTMENEKDKEGIAIDELPQDDSWKLFKPLSLYQGFWQLPVFLEGAIFAQQNFKARPGDIFLCSAPKTGTTWLQALSFATVTRMKYAHDHETGSPLLTKLPHDCVPYLEKDFIKNHRSDDHHGHGHHLWCTHTPYPSLPKSIVDNVADHCKIVYIWRDPKDAFVSLYHFNKNFGPHMRRGSLSMEEAFELFCKGVSFCGPYWDHVLGYWNASLEYPDKVLFLKYEDMMEDTAIYLRKLAEFMGCAFSAEEEDGGEVERIVELCSFDNLSNLEVNKTGKYLLNENVPLSNNVYFRKGKVGDWVNHLSPEMGEKLDQITKDKFTGTGLI